MFSQKSPSLYYHIKDYVHVSDAVCGGTLCLPHSSRGWPSVNCPVGEVSCRRTVLSAKYSVGELSSRWNVCRRSDRVLGWPWGHTGGMTKQDVVTSLPLQLWLNPLGRVTVLSLQHRWSVTYLPQLPGPAIAGIVSVNFCPRALLRRSASLVFFAIFAQ